ncbi:hypothetical protein [Paenibacillus phytorum]|uniref:hypothetical protein n=1 Tax=Paenibacillus phytorum TaxID=2654977 RepID=UPI0035E45F97
MPWFKGLERRINSTDKCRLGRMSCIYQPTLLVLAKVTMCTVPAGTEKRTTCSEHFTVSVRSWEGLAVTTTLRIWAPENDAYIQSTSNRTVQHIKQGTTIVRHLEIRIHKSKRDPDTDLCCFDSLTNTPKGGGTIHKRTNNISLPYGIRTGFEKWYM